MSKQRNIKIAEEILKISDTIKKERSVNYYSSDVLNKIKETREVNITNLKTKLEVCNKDVVETVIKEINKNEGKVGVLNFASAKKPGGGFLTGATAQEESLCRASDLYLYLKNVDEFYKNPKHRTNGLYDNDLIYSKGVNFVLDNSGNLMNGMVTADVITCAAVNLGDIKDKKQNDLLSKVDMEMIIRIENIVEIAIKNEIEVLILGAFGCGVFGNSGYKVKNYFEKVLNDSKYKNRFKKVVFSVYRDNNLYNIFKGIRI
ncbi:TIGR02452 family protein [Lysinibacillus sp. NPDC048646]|uniref:TIGR02452 family protein n=1 Tax=Lysinibacillus sp. NPDC048646 TaxID=3390574 RepID=UPI003D035876